MTLPAPSVVGCSTICALNSFTTLNITMALMPANMNAAKPV